MHGVRRGLGSRMKAFSFYIRFGRSVLTSHCLTASVSLFVPASDSVRLTPCLRPPLHLRDFITGLCGGGGVLSNHRERGRDRQTGRERGIERQRRTERASVLIILSSWAWRRLVVEGPRHSLTDRPTDGRVDKWTGVVAAHFLSGAWSWNALHKYSDTSYYYMRARMCTYLLTYNCAHVCTATTARLDYACVHACAYIHTCMRTCIPTVLHWDSYTHMYAFIYAYLHMYTLLRTYIHMYFCILTTYIGYSRLLIRACMYIHKFLHIYRGHT